MKCSTKCLFFVSFLSSSLFAQEVRKIFYNVIDFEFQTKQSCDNFVKVSTDNFTRLTDAKVMKSFCAPYELGFGIVIATEKRLVLTFLNRTLKTAPVVYETRLQTEVKNLPLFDSNAKIIKVDQAAYSYNAERAVSTFPVSQAECKEKLKKYLDSKYGTNVVFSYCEEDTSKEQASWNFVIQRYLTLPVK